MPLFKFEDFIFDSSIHMLSHRGTKVAIRPKALKLLSLLIQNRHRILSKAEIMTSVWGSDYPRDHLLFQLISELRKSPLKSEFVRTQPNEGYQWNVSTKCVESRIFMPQLAVASLAIVSVCVFLLSLSSLNKTDISAIQSMQLPAYSAFSKGIVAMESGQNNKAIQWFEFALLENPDSVESSIFLAETLYQQNRHEESSNYLQNVLENKNISAYNKATATHILSRISEQQGKFIDALKYAQKSSQTKLLGQCSAGFVEQRIQKLESRIAMSSIPSDVNQDNEKANMTLSKNYVMQCEALKNPLFETSSCLPIKNEGIAFVGGASKSMFSIS